jgi:hypothetical protein
LAFSYIHEVYASATASGDTLTTNLGGPGADGKLDVLAGDLLVGICTWESQNITATIQDDGATNVFTMEARINYLATTYMQLGYRLIGQENDDTAFIFDPSANTAYRGIIIFQFRPDAGETVTVDAGQSGGSGNTNAPQSGDITTTGLDVVTIGGFKEWSDLSGTGSFQIGDIAATYSRNIAAVGNGLWYRILSATEANIHSQCLLTGAAQWVCDIISFKSVAAAGGGGKYLLETSSVDGYLLEDSGGVLILEETVSGFVISWALQSTITIQPGISHA